MKKINEFKELWKQQTAGDSLPDSKAMINLIHKNHRKMIWKHVLLISILILTMAFIIFIGLYYDFELVSTYIGIIIVILSIVFGIILNSGLFRALVPKFDLTLDNKAYLKQMNLYRERHKFIHKKGIKYYFISLSIGFALYIGEFAYINLKFGLIAYAVTFSWIAFAWFFMGKRVVKKEIKKINDQIRSIEDLIKDM